VGQEKGLIEDYQLNLSRLHKNVLLQILGMKSLRKGVVGFSLIRIASCF
jgi:hypothetical protein